MEKLKRIDYLGSFLTVIGSVLLLLGLNWGGITYSWKSAPVLVTLILGIVIFVIFLVWEGKGARLPIVPPRIFRHKTVVGVYIATSMNGMTYFTVLYYVPQFLQLVRGTSPVTSSLLALPFLCPVGELRFVLLITCTR
jgi:predicted MFS family arabinose efflux permease